jgi:hypothetical protein
VARPFNISTKAIAFLLAAKAAGENKSEIPIEIPTIGT